MNKRSFLPLRNLWAGFPGGASGKEVKWSEVKWSEVTQLCPTLCDSMDSSLWGSSVHGIFQARVLEWIAISFSRESSLPRNRTQVSRIAGRRLPSEPPTTCQFRRPKRHRLDLWVRKIPWRRAWQPTAVFLPGESHGQRSLVGYGPLGCKESDTIEVT